MKKTTIVSLIATFVLVGIGAKYIDSKTVSPYQKHLNNVSEEVKDDENKENNESITDNTSPNITEPQYIVDGVCQFVSDLTMTSKMKHTFYSYEFYSGENVKEIEKYDLAGFIEGEYPKELYDVIVGFNENAFYKDMEENYPELYEFKFNPNHVDLNEVYSDEDKAKFYNQILELDEKHSEKKPGKVGYVFLKCEIENTSSIEREYTFTNLQYLLKNPNDEFSDEGVRLIYLDKPNVLEEDEGKKHFYEHLFKPGEKADFVVGIRLCYEAKYIDNEPSDDDLRFGYFDEGASSISKMLASRYIFKLTNINKEN